MKSGVRYIAIASGPIKKGRTCLIGVIFRNSYIEGVLSGAIEADGTDATGQIIRMVRRSRFAAQIRILLFNGIALAGLNIINPGLLERELDAKVVLLNRRRQNPKELIKALGEFSRLKRKDVKSRIKTVEAYGAIKPLRVNGLYMQSSLDNVYLKAFAESAFEAIRIAHIVARGVSTGESKGRI